MISDTEFNRDKAENVIQSIKPAGDTNLYNIHFPMYILSWPFAHKSFLRVLVTARMF